MRKSFALLTSFLFIAQLVGFLFLRQDSVENAHVRLERESRHAAREIASRLQALKGLADNFAARMGKADYDDSQVIDDLKELAASYPGMFGAGVAYLPYAAKQDKKLYAPYVINRSSGSSDLVFVEDIYDYTAKEHFWYHDSLSQGSGWLEPYYGKASQTVLAEYTVTVHRNGKALAVVFVGYSLENIQKQILSLDIGATGYGIISSNSGKVLYHPTESRVHLGENLRDIQPTKFLLEGREQFSYGFYETLDPSSSEPLWLYHTPVGEESWNLIIVADKDELFMDQESYKGSVFCLIVTSIAVAISLSFILSQKAWLRAIVASLAFLIGIICIWVLSHDQGLPLSKENTRILSQPGLDRFLTDYRETSRLKRLPEPRFIPTGVFIQSIEFTASPNVRVTGYIWQRYRKGLDDDIERGFIFPEAQNAKIQEAYRHQNESDEVVGYYFSAELRESFEYAKYPLDNETVWLRIWHKSFDKNYVLTPDLQSYRYLSPVHKSGLEESFVLPGWTVRSTNFDYRKSSYNANFGIDGYAGQDDFPELYFNIHLQREFIQPFVTHILPLTVAVLLLFLILMLESKTPDRSCAALFFIVIFDHIAVRRKLAHDGIAYLEWFHLLTYTMILIVAVDLYFLIKHEGMPGINRRTRALKLFFWPFVLGATFLITFLTFYP